MATTKKKPATTTKKAPSRTTAKAAPKAAPRTAKKPAAQPRTAAKAQPAARPKTESGLIAEVIGVGLIGLGLFSLLCVFTELGGMVGHGLRQLSFGLFGALGYALGGIMIWIGFLTIKRDGGPMRNARSVYIGLLILCVVAFWHIGYSSVPPSEDYFPSIAKAWQTGTSLHTGGGALGEILSYPLMKLLGVWGSFIAVTTISLILLLLITRVSIKAAYRKVRTSVAHGLEELEKRRPASRYDYDDYDDYEGEFDDFDEYYKKKAPPARGREKRPALNNEIVDESLLPDPIPRKPVSQAPPPRPAPQPQDADDIELPAFVNDRSHRRLSPPVVYVPDDGLYNETIDVPALTVNERAEQSEPEPPEEIEVEICDSDEDDYAPAPEVDDAIFRRPEAEPEPPPAPIEPTVFDRNYFEPQVQLEVPPAPPVTAPPVTAPPVTAPPVAAPEKPLNPADNSQDIDIEAALDAPLEETPPYRFPSLNLLGKTKAQAHNPRDDERAAQKLIETLESFGVKARVLNVTHGPAITRFEIQPAPGVKVARIVSLADDIALNMAAMGLRIEAPIPGKAAIGIEIANEHIAAVGIRNVLESNAFQQHDSTLACALGEDITGKKIVADLAKMPHLLIAGATGSGKSVCINTLVTSILYKAAPEEVQLIMIDPKVVELSVYNGIPHLRIPVVTDPKKAASALRWAVTEMTERYNAFAESGVRDIAGYNAQLGDDEPLMPKIVVIIDELADLMMVASSDVEDAITRLAQLARAAGIHLVIATQRPSVNVITGVIKANIPSRIAFAVSSQVDSRTILDSAGAEKLLGRGDMLYYPSGASKPTRVQGAFVSDAEVQSLVDFVKSQRPAEYDKDVIEKINEEHEEEAEMATPDSVDPKLAEAMEYAWELGQISISMLQRRMRIGYARAGRLIDELTQRGMISAQDGAKPREILVGRAEFERMYGSGGAPAPKAEPQPVAAPEPAPPPAPESPPPPTPELPVAEKAPETRPEPARVTAPAAGESVLSPGELESLLTPAMEFAFEDGEVSSSMLRERFSLNYAQAKQLLNEMTRRGWLAMQDGAYPREVRVSRADFLAERAKPAQPKVAEKKEAPIDPEDMNALLDTAMEYAFRDGQISISMLQRHLRLSYAQAMQVIEKLASRGIIEKGDGQTPLSLLMSRNVYMDIYGAEDESAYDDEDAYDDDEPPFDLD